MAELAGDQLALLDEVFARYEERLAGDPGPARDLWREVRGRASAVSLLEGAVLWAVVEWDLNDLMDLGRDELIEEAAVGPDRRLYATRAAAEQAAVSEFRAGRVDGANAEWRAEAASRGEEPDPEDLAEMPAVAWRDVGEGEGPQVLDHEGGPASRVWVVADWDTRYFVVPMAVVR